MSATFTDREGNRITLDSREHEVLIRVDKGNGWPATVRFELDQAATVLVAFVAEVANVMRFEVDDILAAGRAVRGDREIP